MWTSPGCRESVGLPRLLCLQLKINFTTEASQEAYVHAKPRVCVDLAAEPSGMWRAAQYLTQPEK